MDKLASDAVTRGSQGWLTLTDAVAVLILPYPKRRTIQFLEVIQLPLLSIRRQVACSQLESGLVNAKFIGI
jgi:hypothetical protein